MKIAQIATQRLINQQLAASEITDIKSMISHLGAMQAQDFNMAKWAIGLRLPKTSLSEINKSFDDGDLVRTHVLRPTWHITAAEDIGWMLELTAPNIKRLMATNDRKLGLDANVYKKALDLIGNALADGDHLTRKELMEVLQFSNIDTSDYRSGHFMAMAELERLVISGKQNGKEQTYALLDDRVKTPKKLSREEALAELAKRYFTSHGPAQLIDFTWWSGLNKTDCKMAIALNEGELRSTEIEGETYFFSNWHEVRKSKSALLLPAFDEYFVGYKDRSAVLLPEHNRHTITINGIFKPVLLLDGQCVGTWKKTVAGKNTSVEKQFLVNVPVERQTNFGKSEKAFLKFFGTD